MIRTLIIGICLLIRTFSALSQLSMTYVEPSVYHGADSLDLAWSGGINGVQFNEVDLDLDGDQDLVLFDRSSERITCFENAGNRYVLNTNFAAQFPTLQHWMLMRDYNCDGRNDLFTYSNLGIQLYENVIIDETVQFESVLDPIRSQGFNANINVFPNPTDIPVIEDLDGDGDLDILVADFASGDHIHFHENISAFNNTCRMQLTRVTQSYGRIDICDCDDFAFEGKSCHTGARVQHVLGKALMAYDHDADGDMDLVMSQEGCNNLNFLENFGGRFSYVYSNANNTFPSFRDPLDFVEFPAAFRLDVDFDGQKDILISPNVRESDETMDFAHSSSVYQEGELRPFLQDRMIDVGEYAYPQFADIDGDGIQDLVIGNGGAISNGSYKASLTIYRGRTEGFEWVSDDFGGLAALNATHMRPQFVNLNQDSFLDLSFTAIVNGDNRLYILIADGGQFSAAEAQLIDIELEDSDQAFLYDYNRDGVLDILRANRFGEIDYFENDGSHTAFQLRAAQSNLFDIPAEASYLDMSIDIGDVNGDDLDDLIFTTRQGRVRAFMDFIRNKTVIEEFVIDSTYSPYFGRMSFPVIGIVNNQTVFAIGDIAGGVHMLEVDQSSEEVLQVQTFPNPVVNGLLTIQAPLQTTVEVLNPAGQVLMKSTMTNDRVEQDLSMLSKGLYLLRFKNEGQQLIERIVVK